MTIPLIVVLAVMGALLGSFGCAQVWRLRAKQLVEDKAEYEQVYARGERPKRSDYYDAAELKRLHRLLQPIQDDRSQCLSCHHQLAWYDLIPLFSWLSLRGRCRYCGTPIGYLEPLAEVILSIVFVTSYLMWPHPLNSIVAITAFGCWLIACLLMLILFIYDAKWSLLPFSINIILIVVAAIFALLVGGAYGYDILSLLGAAALLCGLYALFALFRWAGFGDSILGLGLALLLGQWQLAFLALFLANIFGCLMLIPLLIRHRLHRQLRIPFGPFMILGTFVAMLWGTHIIAWFSTATGSLFMTLML